MRSLDEITTEIGAHHAAKTKEEGELKTVRNEFFEVATAMVEQAPLATMVVTIPDSESVAEYIAKYHPGWKAQSLRDLYDPKPKKVVIEEDPAYQTFIFINKADGKKYQRNAIQGQPLLDDETLQEQDPELWEEITVPSRTLKPAAEIFPAYSSRLEPYLVPAPISLKLEPPRKATAEELNED